MENTKLENNNKNIDKKIIRAYDILKKFNKSNKFKQKKINNFIYVFFLYIQNNYNLDFHFKDQTKEKSLYKCIKSLYSDFSEKKAKSILFPKDPLLLDIFINGEKFKPEKYLQKLTDTIYSNNYINLNVEILDYLGNSNKDTKIINNTLCLIFFKELYPNIPIDKQLINHLVKTLITMANITNNINKTGDNIVKYTNTHAIFLLILLKKISHFKHLDTWIYHLLDNQLNNGKWNNGFNSYFASNPELLDIVHTALATIVLLEYKTITVHKQYILPNDTDSETDDEENVKDNEIKENVKDNENKNVKDNEIKEIKENIKETKNIENFVNKELINKKEILEKKQIIEKFDQINTPNKGSYYFNFNVYNITLLILTIILTFFLLQLNKKIKN